MRQECTVLVVAKTRRLTRRLEFALRAGGLHTRVANTFHDAKACLDRLPRVSLIVSEMKLGEFNGLHLALRGQALHIPAIVLGERAFAREAEQLGVAWLSETDVDSDALQGAVARLIDVAALPHDDFARSPDTGRDGSPDDDGRNGAEPLGVRCRRPTVH
jgi:DNA-binding NtrC family response regulator